MRIPELRLSARPDSWWLRSQDAALQLLQMKGSAPMVTRLILFLLVALGGAGLTLQVVWNARLRASTTSPVLTSIISVLVTLLSLALVWASGATERGALPAGIQCAAKLGLVWRGICRCVSGGLPDRTAEIGRCGPLFAGDRRAI
jgi:hypothetical protein